MKNKCMIRQVIVHNLRCNNLVNPIGVEGANPLLSWEISSDGHGLCQKAYRILAASNPSLLEAGIGDLWDSGTIESDSSIHVAYGGIPLISRQQVFWKVQVKLNVDTEATWSKPVFFEMGLLDQKDWKAKWICSPLGGTDIEAAIPAPLFRKAFTINKRVESARAYVCGLGYYELYFNGAKIGDEVLTPAFTRYDMTVLYNTYDITDAFHQGENVVGAILGNGWYNCFTEDAWDYREALWRHHPKLLLQLHMIFEDGEETLIITDSSWKVSTGPIVFDGLRNGEFYDARLEKKGWNNSGYIDEDWDFAKIARRPGGLLRSSQMTPIRVTGTIPPVGLKEMEPKVWVFDLGQNISGWARIRVSGSVGTEITLKYAEKLKDDGSINQSNTGMHIKSGECQTDRYVLKGEGIEVWEPRFTYHGFQYIQVSGFPGVPAMDSVCGRVVHTDLNTLGEFECSNELLNKIQQCARWSTLTNYHGIPTDCPHREKNGWTGDSLMSLEQVLMNFDPITAYIKWMKDFKDAQRPSGQLPGIIPTGGWGYNWGSGPAWDSAIILIPWHIYQYYGDISILNEMYDNMKCYINYMTSMAEENIVNFGLGDWCPPVGEAHEHKCPTAVTDTAYYYVDALIFSKIAALLGKSEDSSEYSELAESIRNSFRKSFYNIETGSVSGDCQTSLACALYQGLIDDEEKPKVLQRLIEEIEQQDFHIDCGILGTKYLLHTLSDLGRTDLAYKIATQTTFPGWGYWISQGATTLWETWDGSSSRNHHMFSDISAWFYKGLAGINPDPLEPGFKHIILNPNPVEGLRWVKCKHRSMYGSIACNWKTEGNELIMEIEVPVNCHATLYIPKDYSKQIRKNGISVADGDLRRVAINGEMLFTLRLESGGNVIAVSKDEK